MRGGRGGAQVVAVAAGFEEAKALWDEALELIQGAQRRGRLGSLSAGTLEAAFRRRAGGLEFSGRSRRARSRTLAESGPAASERLLEQLMTAVEQGKRDQLNDLLARAQAQATIPLIARRLVRHSTVVHAAVRADNLKMVRALLSRGFDVNTPDSDGFYPIHEACSIGSVEMMQMLVHVPAIRVMCLSPDRALPLHYLAERPLSPSISDRLLSVVSAMYQSGVFLDAATRSYARTPLHKAALVGNVAMARALLSLGAFPNCLDVNGDAPLHLAVRGEHLDVISVLIQYGADSTVAGRAGTPLDMAHQLGLKNVASHLATLLAEGPPPAPAPLLDPSDWEQPRPTRKPAAPSTSTTSLAAKHSFEEETLTALTARCEHCHGALKFWTTVCTCTQCQARVHVKCQTKAYVSGECHPATPMSPAAVALMSDNEVDDQPDDVLSSDDLDSSSARFSESELRDVVEQFRRLRSLRERAGLSSMFDQLQASFGAVFATPDARRLAASLFAPPDASGAPPYDINATDYVRALSVMMRGTDDERAALLHRTLQLHFGRPVKVSSVLRALDVVYGALRGLDLGAAMDVTTLRDAMARRWADDGVEAGELTPEGLWTAVAGGQRPLLDSLGLFGGGGKAVPAFLRHEGRPPPEGALQVAPGHRLWPLVMTLALALRRSVSEALAADVRDIEPRHFDEVADLALGPECTYEVREHAPAVFASMRAKYGVKAEEFAHCLGPERLLGGALLHATLATPFGLRSSARSGSVFLSSSLGPYMLKTIAPDEHAFLCRYLPDYLDYMSENPSSLLPRFLGLYQVRHRHNREDVTLVVVMNNIFDPFVPPDEHYDLKGSKIDRLVDVSSLESSGHVAMKDLNFRRKLAVGMECKCALLEQVERDTLWLEARNICDYSLLVGVRPRLTPGGSDAPNTSGRKRASTGPSNPSRLGGPFSLIVSEDASEEYYLGIIDILTVYNLKKRGERWAKSFRHDPQKISAMPPRPYRSRFQRFICSILSDKNDRDVSSKKQEASYS